MSDRLKRAPLFWMFCLAGVTACGGGGGGGSSSAPSANDGSVQDPPANEEGDGSQVRFADTTSVLGLDYFIENTSPGDEATDVSGGLTLDDIDNDGNLELYVAHGRDVQGRLFSFDGTSFLELEDNNGILPLEMDRAGYFIDLDADGWKDFISIQDESVEVFMNDQTGQFQEATADTNLFHQRSTFSMAAADIDLDGDVDLFFSHWDGIFDSSDVLTEYLWQNDGTGVFTDISDRVAITEEPAATVAGFVLELSYTPTFADIDNDGYPDMLLASDGGFSQVLRNEAGLQFTDATDRSVITDTNGMGGTVTDYDHDGDLDWFVTSIHNLETSGEGTITGNRLYRNEDGLGNFVDVTDEAGVRNGDWGWGGCFADFDNDGHPDLFHTNGMPNVVERYADDPSRLFMANGDGSFSERAFSAGITHDGRGLGVVCADYNGDGRIDILIANNGQSPTVYENITENNNHYLTIDLVGKGANPDAIGARVTIESATRSQLQEVQLGTWYLSQGPATLHFGLGQDDTVTAIDIRWPEPGLPTTRIENVAVDQRIVVEQP